MKNDHRHFHTLNMLAHALMHKFTHIYIDLTCKSTLDRMGIYHTSLHFSVPHGNSHEYHCAITMHSRVFYITIMTKIDLSPGANEKCQLIKAKLIYMCITCIVSKKLESSWRRNFNLTDFSAAAVPLAWRSPRIDAGIWIGAISVWMCNKNSNATQIHKQLTRWGPAF